MYSMQGYKCVSYGTIMHSFQNNKVCELTSSVFYNSLCLFRRNNYTFGVVSWGRLWNILYEKAGVLLCQNLIMRCYVIILAGNLWRSDFFRTGFVKALHQQVILSHSHQQIKTICQRVIPSWSNSTNFYSYLINFPQQAS